MLKVTKKTQVSTLALTLRPKNKTHQSFKIKVALTSKVQTNRSLQGEVKTQTPPTNKNQNQTSLPACKAKLPSRKFRQYIKTFPREAKTLTFTCLSLGRTK
jgi:hypothetical protein